MRSALLLLPLPVSLAVSIPLSARHTLDEIAASNPDTLPIETFRNLDPETIANIISAYFQHATSAPSFPPQKENETAIASAHTKWNVTVIESPPDTLAFALCSVGYGLYCSGHYHEDGMGKDGLSLYSLSGAKESTLSRYLNRRELLSIQILMTTNR
jgi:hypothetical protein